MLAVPFGQHVAVGVEGHAHDLHTAFRAFQRLQVGGVIVGDVPSYRTDNLSYGGVKDSGDGREGIRCAMTDYTQERVLVLTDVTL